MKERIKIIAGVLSFAMVFGIFASCGGNSNSADENSDSISDTAEIPNSSVETVESPWTEEPEIKSVFFSDFGREENIGENWSVVNYSWGQNGVTRENAGFYSFSRCRAGTGCQRRNYRAQFVRGLL